MKNGGLNPWIGSPVGRARRTGARWKFILDEDISLKKIYSPVPQNKRPTSMKSKFVTNKMTIGPAERGDQSGSPRANDVPTVSRETFSKNLAFKVSRHERRESIQTIFVYLNVASIAGWVIVSPPVSSEEVECGVTRRGLGLQPTRPQYFIFSPCRSASYPGRDNISVFERGLRGRFPANGPTTPDRDILFLPHFPYAWSLTCGAAKG